MKKIADLAYYLVSKKPVSVILIILGVFSLSFGAFSNVEMADDFESGISDTATVRTLAEYKAKFTSENQILIAFPIDRIDKDSVLKLFTLVKALERHSHVKKVVSALDLLKKIEDIKEFKKYLQEFRLANLRKLLSKNAIFKNFLVSEDEKAFQLVVLPDTRYVGFQKKLYTAVNSTLSSIFNEQPYHIFGFMYFKQRFFEFIETNNKVFLTLSFIICSFLAWFFFPDVAVLILILFAITIPVVLTFALYFANGNKINIFTSPIIPFALIISLNEIIYLVSFFVKSKNETNLTYDELHKKNFYKLLKPCLITSITTLIGFLALSNSPSLNIQLFSLYTSLACFLAYFVAFGLVFSFLKLYKPSFTLVETSKKRSHRFRRVLRNIVFRHTAKLLIVTSIIAVLSVALISNYQVRNRLDDTFSKSDTIYTSWKFMKNKLSGPYQLMLMVSDQNILSKPFLEKVDAFQKEIMLLPSINRTFSLVDLLKSFNKTFTSEDVIPSSIELMRSILAYFDADGISEMLVSSNVESLLIRISISITDDFKIKELGNKIQTIANKHFSAENTAAKITGEIYAQSVLQVDILKNITGSFAWAIGIISIVLFVVFQSVPLSLIALMVNFFPILFSYAVASAIGIPLNPSTAVAGCVMSGLIVDDTLHLLTFFVDSRQKTTKRRLLSTMKELTWPVVYSSILLGLGNLIFVFSDFKPFKYFGAIGALIVVSGIIGDLLILPACLLALEKVKKHLDAR